MMTRESVALSRRAGLPIWRRIGWRLTAAVLLLTAVGILGSGLLQYRAQERFLRESLGGLLLNIARTGALLVDGDTHEQVVRAARNDTPGYLALRDHLLLIQETNRLGDAVYTLSNVEGDMARYGVISNGLAQVGQAYRLAPETRPVLRRVLAQGEAGFTGIYASDDGRWITAFAPIRNRAEQTVGALEVDFRADVYLAQLQAVRRRLWLHSLVAGLLAVGAGMLISRQVTRPVGQLVTAAQRVVEGDLATPVRVDARDEIGLLGNVFHLMVDRCARRTEAWWTCWYARSSPAMARADRSRAWPGRPWPWARSSSSTGPSARRSSWGRGSTTSARSGSRSRCCTNRVPSRPRSGCSCRGTRRPAWRSWRWCRCSPRRSTWSPATTSATTAEGIPRASKPTRSRWSPGCSRSWTRSTR